MSFSFLIIKTDGIISSGDIEETPNSQFHEYFSNLMSARVPSAMDISFPLLENIFNIRCTKRVTDRGREMYNIRLVCDKIHTRCEYEFEATRRSSNAEIALSSVICP